MPAEAQRLDILRVTLRKHLVDSPLTPIHPGLLASSSGTAGAATSSRDASQDADGKSNGGANGAGAAASAAAAAAAAPGGEEDQLKLVAAHTEGFSGSDLVQLCSEAARLPMQEYMLALDAPKEAAGARCAQGSQA